MLYDIKIRITYRYASGADAGRQAVRLLPADIAGIQKVIATSLDVRPHPAEWIKRTDFFGNDTVDIAFVESLVETELVAQARVERLPVTADFGGTVSREDLPAMLSGVREIGPASPHHFTMASPRIPENADIAAYAKAAVGGAVAVGDAVTALGQALHRDMRFDAEATTVDTPLSDAFANRHGVCQDFSHIMIAGLRSLGIPAGYVSGYLRTLPPEGQPRLEGADAMHAWVSAWAGEDAGWIEYDPTNAMPAGEDHIVVGRGRDYGDVAPVIGVLRTAGGQDSEQAVDVIPINQD